MFIVSIQKIYFGLFRENRNSQEDGAGLDGGRHEPSHQSEGHPLLGPILGLRRSGWQERASGMVLGRP